MRQSGQFNRRQFLSATSLGLLAYALGQPSKAWADSSGQRNLNAFNARSPESLYAALGLPAPIPSDLIQIDAPDVAENGANVPIEVNIGLANPQRALLVADRNVYPLVADVQFGARSEPWIEAKIKLAETSNVRVLVLANNQLYAASRPIKVIVGGCLAG